VSSECASLQLREPRTTRRKVVPLEYRICPGAHTVLANILVSIYTYIHQSNPCYHQKSYSESVKHLALQYMSGLILVVHGCIEAGLFVVRGKDLCSHPHPWSVHRLLYPAANRRDCMSLAELSIAWDLLSLNQMVVLFLEN